MGATLEQIFYEKLAEMPSDVRINLKINPGFFLTKEFNIGNWNNTSII